MGEWVSGEKREESELVLSVKKGEEKEKTKNLGKGQRRGPPFKDHFGGTFNLTVSCTHSLTHSLTRIQYRTNMHIQMDAYTRTNTMVRMMTKINQVAYRVAYSIETKKIMLAFGWIVYIPWAGHLHTSMCTWRGTCQTNRQNNSSKISICAHFTSSSFPLQVAKRTTQTNWAGRTSISFL